MRPSNDPTRKQAVVDGGGVSVVVAPMGQAAVWAVASQHSYLQKRRGVSYADDETTKT